MLIRVQVFDNSDLSPLAEAAVEVYGNQSNLASSKAAKDGVVMVTFLYRPGTWVIVTATKQGFVTNSAPWHASRIPCKYCVSSLTYHSFTSGTKRMLCCCGLPPFHQSRIHATLCDHVMRTYSSQSYVLNTDG